MRKHVLMLTGLFLLWPAWSNAQLQWHVLSPTTCTVRTDAPVQNTFEFSAFGGSAIFRLTNGDLVDSSVEKVRDFKVSLSGQATFRFSNFNQYGNHFEEYITLSEGQNRLEVLLNGNPGSQVTIEIVQEVPVITPEIARVQTANALRVGNIPYALKGFQQDAKRQKIIYALDAELRNLLAHRIEKGELVRETKNMRFYQYNWSDVSGKNFIEFTMARDHDGKWIITSW